MSDSVKIKATLKMSGDQYVFDVPTTKNVKQGDSVYWKVEVKDVTDPSTVGLSVVFHGSNSETVPPSNGLGQRNYPFPANTWTSSATDASDRTQAQFTLDFDKYSASDKKWSTTSMVVQQDSSLEDSDDSETTPLPIVYNYSLVASVPANQLPNGFSGNSDQSVKDWPNISTANGGSKYLIVQCDPELYVDEC
jgi:hypothetical protein